MSDNDSGLGAFFAGFVIGGLTGAAVALLLAPQSGEETREMIRERGIELKMRAEQTADELRVRAGETAGAIKSRAEKAVGEGREKLEDVAESVRQRLPRRKADSEI